jgi:hypothetical protein
MMSHINPDVCLSRGVTSLGADLVIKTLQNLHQAYEVPIVSVGCGLAAIEYLSKLMCWRLVDPDPLSWQIFKEKPDHPFLPVNYSSVDELIAKEPSLIHNCILFLNWCEPNESEYDYEAVIKLKPLAILTIIEVYGGNGAAGGEKFYEWYAKLPNRVDVEYPQLQTSKHPAREKYVVGGVTYLEPYDHNFDVDDIRLVWIHQLNRNSTAFPKVELPNRVATTKYSKGCVVM